MKIDLIHLNKLVEDKYINVQKHPEHSLFIYNYSQKCQYDKYWNELTLQCRGLILDTEGNIIARPFKKFFNYEEHLPEEIPNEEFEIFEKLDGSLGIGFFYKGEFHFATRGSFISDQAKKARTLITTDQIELLPKEGVTFLFEIIYKENRIVCNYEDQEKLVLLDIIKNHDGSHLNYSELILANNSVKFDLVKRYDRIKDYKAIKSLIKDDQEGFVIRFNSGFRVKVKGDEYCRLHRILSQVSTKTVWEYLSEKKDFNELLERVPDEFYNWVREVKLDLEKQYKDVIDHCQNELNKIMVNPILAKKDFAIKVIESKYSAVLFKMYEEKDIDTLVWRMIKPKYEKSFVSKIEE